MAGGGGDTPTPSPLNGGEFLLQLLQRPVHHQQTPPFQHHQQQQRQQPVPPSHDPAVAAVGPTLHHPFQPFPSNGHDLPYRPPWTHSPSPPLAPHQFFLQGFHQNPNPSFSPPQTHAGFNRSLQQNLQLNHNLLSDDIRKLGFLGTNADPNSAPQHQEQNLMFGSLPCNFPNSEGTSNGNSYNNLSKEREIGPGNRILNGLEVESHNSLELNRNPQHNSHGFRSNEQERGNRGGNYRSAPVKRPPPGFHSKPVSGSTFEHDINKGKSTFNQMSNKGFAFDDERARVQYGDSSGGRGLAVHHNRRGPPSGSNSHMVSPSDVEESVLELHDDDAGQGQCELDESEEQRLIGNLVLEDGSDEKKDRNKNPSSRDKDYRSDKRGQWLLNQRMRISKRRIECRSDIDSFNSSFLAIYESLIPPEEEKMKQKQLLTLLEKHVTKEWPEAKLFLYGSCANSFGFTKSDIDVCLTIGDADVNKSEILLKLADILQSDNLQNVQALTHARVPIVKLMDPATGISCDICVNNLLAVVNTKLLRDYAQIDVRLRQLAFLVKHWAKSRGVNETYRGTLSSYAYVLMCIHLLQQRRPAILPCLQGMKSTYAVTFETVECSYFDQVEKLHSFGSRNGESIAQLIWAFFNYWAYCHDYANDVISIRTGSILSKRAKFWTTRVRNDRHLICIEDPFEVDHDLGRVVDKFSIRVLREEFERAAEILQYDPDPCTALFQPYVPS